MKLAIAFFLAFVCSVSAAKDETYMTIREVPQSVRSEALFIYFQQIKPTPTASPFNGTQQGHKA